MRKILMVLLTTLFSVCSVAWAGPYENEPKDCTYTIEHFKVDWGKEIPVVCSQPVNIYDLLDQPRERVEAVLGPSVGVIKEGFGDGFTYRGGGIVVAYRSDKSYIVRISTKNLKLDNKSIQDFFSTKALPSKASLRDPSFVRYCAGEINGGALVIQTKRPGEFYVSAWPKGWNCH